MRERRFEGGDVRQVLIGMITDRAVCARVASQWTTPGLFGSDWANLIGGIVVGYFKEYGAHPDASIVGLFEAWARETKAPDEVIKAIESFLQIMSNQHDRKKETSDYILDVAARLFLKVRLEKEIELAKFEIEDGKIEEAQVRLSALRKVNLGVGSYVEPASTPEIWVEALSRDRMKPLVEYRGALGEFVGDAFTRGSLFAFMAPDKTGKTKWMIDFAYRAIRNRNRVAFFDCGDSNQQEVLTQFACRSTGRPEWDCKINVPTKWSDQDSTKPDFQVRELEAVDPFEGYRKFHRDAGIPDAMRIACYDNTSMSVDDIDGVLAEWDRDGWRPDVIVIDYADILAPPKHVKDRLDAIDETWKALRRMSQHRHALVMTATQSSSLAYSDEAGDLMTKQHFSGRKTKIAHVNGMLGINIKPEERELEVARINWIVRRRGKYNELAFCRVAGCMAFAHPAMISTR